MDVGKTGKVRHTSGMLPDHSSAEGQDLPYHAIDTEWKSYRHAEQQETSESCIPLHVQQCCDVYSPLIHNIASGNHE